MVKARQKLNEKFALGQCQTQADQLQYAIYWGAIDDELLWVQECYVGKCSLTESRKLSISHLQAQNAQPVEWQMCAFEVAAAAKLRDFEFIELHPEQRHSYVTRTTQVFCYGLSTCTSKPHKIVAQQRFRTVLPSAL